MRARRPVRAEQLHALDSRGAGSPLLQTGTPLSRIEVTRELLAVTHDRIVRRPVELDTAVSQQHGTIAETFDRCRIVRDEDNRAAPLLELEDLAEALALKLLVADREDLVQQQDVGIDVRRNREPEAHVHPDEYVRTGRSMNSSSSGEGDDLVQLLAHVSALEAVDRAVEEDVLAAGQVGVETRAELEQRARPARRRRHCPDVGLMIPESRRRSVVLPEPLRPTRPIALPGSTSEGDVAQRPDLRAGATGGWRRRRPSADALRADTP